MRRIIIVEYHPALLSIWLKVGFDCSKLRNRQVDERDVSFQEDCSTVRVGLSLMRGGSILGGDPNDLFNIVNVSLNHRIELRGADCFLPLSKELERHSSRSKRHYRPIFRSQTFSEMQLCDDNSV